MTTTTNAGHDAQIEAMLLAAGADGKVTKIEMEAIFARIYGQPEFSAYEKDQLRETVEAAAERVARAPSVGAVCGAIADRLETIGSRERVFCSAAFVALIDHRADWRELETLKALQETFGLSETRVVQLFEKAETVAQALASRPPSP